MSEGFWYLATPYSQYPAGREAAYREACKQTALLVKAKVPVFCPITHTHGPGEMGIVGNDLETWLVADRPFMDAAKGLIVCKMDSWFDSAGIVAEMKVFRVAGKPILYMEPGTVPWQLRAKGHEEVAPILGPDLDANGNPVVLYDENKPRLYEGRLVYPGISLKAGALNTVGKDGSPQYQLSGEAPDDSARRVFATGATRNHDSGKPDYEGYLSPRAITAFGDYMLKHSLMEDGTRRVSDNWQLGIPNDSFVKSAFRHYMDWWREHRGIKTTAGLKEALCGLVFNAMGRLDALVKEEEADLS